MWHLSLSLRTASEPFLLLSQPKEVHCCNYLLVQHEPSLSAALKLCEWLLQMPLFLDTGFHFLCPQRYVGKGRGGDRKEGREEKGESLLAERGEKKPSEIQNKWFLIHREAGNSSHPNRDTPLWQTSILMIVGFVVTAGNSPAPLCSSGFSEAPSPACLFCRSRRSCWNTAAEMGNNSGCSIFQLAQQITCSNSKGWQGTGYYRNIFPGR